jgi:hypothetical protein
MPLDVLLISFFNLILVNLYADLISYLIVVVAIQSICVMADADRKLKKDNSEILKNSASQLGRGRMSVEYST